MLVAGMNVVPSLANAAPTQYLARNRAAMDNGSTLSAQHLTEEGPVCDYSAD